MANQHKLQKIVLATATFICLASAQVNGIAQAADSGTLNISGQITSTTCNIVISDVGSTGTNSFKTINLGTFAATTGAALSTISNAVGAVFTVSSTAASTTPCTFGTGTSKWDIALSLIGSQVSSINGLTFVKNSVAGGTDAVVQLKGGIGNTLASVSNTPLSLIADQGINGTLISGALTPTATAGSSIVLSAQLLRSAAAAPSSGLFSATIPLLAVYK